MARPSTGAWNVYESLRIEMTYLLKNGFIKKGCVISSSLSWSNQYGNSSGNIAFQSSYLGPPDTNYIHLIYTLTKDGEKLDRNYKVYLHEQESNLGKGKVLYFLCPVNHSKCRILYSAYGSDFFKSRTAYRHRLYYDCQQSSKISRYNDNYWRIENHLKKLKQVSCCGNRTFKGDLTKASKRYNRLRERQYLMDRLRWSSVGMPRILHQYIKNGGLDF
jgi:hypothetical protein